MTGHFQELLEKRGDSIREGCLRAALAPFSKEAARFYGSEGDGFRNPVGRTMADGVRALAGWLVAGGDEEAMRGALREMVRVFAVQDFPPSKALGFIFSIRDILKREGECDAGSIPSGAESAVLDGRIEDLALLAFDLYLECREKIYQIRTNEMKASTFKLLERAQRRQGADCGGTDPGTLRAEP